MHPTMAPTTMSNGTSGQRNATRLKSGESRHNMIHAPKTKMQMTIQFIVGFNVAAGSPPQMPWLLLSGGFELGHIQGPLGYLPPPFMIALPAKIQITPTGSVTGEVPMPIVRDTVENNIPTIMIAIPSKYRRPGSMPLLTIFFSFECRSDSSDEIGISGFVWAPVGTGGACGGRGGCGDDVGDWAIMVIPGIVERGTHSLRPSCHARSEEPITPALRFLLAS